MNVVLYVAIRCIYFICIVNHRIISLFKIVCVCVCVYIYFRKSDIEVEVLINTFSSHTLTKMAVKWNCAVVLTPQMHPTNATAPIFFLLSPQFFGLCTLLSSSHVYFCRSWENITRFRTINLHWWFIFSLTHHF